MAFTGFPFKSATRAAVVAVALGAASLSAAPAFAQSMSSGFSIEIQGNGGSAPFDGGQRRWNHRDHGQDFRLRCLSDREVVRGISAYGYNRVEITRQLRGDRVMLEAVQGNWRYAMRVDKCTGQVDRLERIGRVFGGHRDRDRFDGGYRPHGGHSGGGFGFQFNFGN